MIRPDTLSVLPNPWTAIDHRGRPSGAVLCDPDEHVFVHPDDPDPPRRFVGARIVEAVETAPARTITIGGVTQQLAYASHDIRWEFDAEPIEVPNTGYYRDRLRHGELIAADEDTAIEGSVKFVEPIEALKAAKDRALAELVAHHGEGAFEKLERRFVKAEKRRTGAASIEIDPLFGNVKFVMPKAETSGAPTETKDENAAPADAAASKADSAKGNG